MQQVVAAQPDFAHGWAMLSGAYRRGTYVVPNDAVALRARADEYAEKALALDPHEGEAWFARRSSSAASRGGSGRMEVSTRTATTSNRRTPPSMP